MKSSTIIAGADLAVSARVAAYAALEVGPEQIAGLRRQPGPGLGTLPPAALKNADEQTIAALAAVLQARSTFGLGEEDMSQWSVLAAPVYLGRSTTHAAIQRFRQEGAWGVSPHLIPQFSLHAVPGTISQLLHIHGPNLGIGNAPDAAHEAFLVAATTLSERYLPGIWLVFTEFESEVLPGDQGRPLPKVRAVALALKDPQANVDGLHLRICPYDRDADFVQALAPFALPSFAEELTRNDGAMWRTSDGAWVELEWLAAMEESKL